MDTLMTIGVGILILALAIGGVYAIITYNSEGPAVKEANKLAAQLNDQRQAGDIINSVVAQQVPCGRVAKLAFDPRTGNARVWTFRMADGNLECYNSPGFHRTARGPLMGITTLEVDEIMSRPDLYPVPASRPQGTSVPAPQPQQIIVRVETPPSPPPCPDSEWSPPMRPGVAH
jgi:hypothetical protein